MDSNIVLSAEESASGSASTRKKPMSPAEILAQQRTKSGLPDYDEHPKLYSDELLDDMRNVLVVLEKRVQGGQGSISPAEIDDFAKMSNNILVESKQKEYERLQDASSPSSGPSPAGIAPATTASESSTNTPADNAVVEKPAVEEEEYDPNVEGYDPEIEGPDYDPAGGQGSIPRETTNTYIIPGMDAMSPEVYRAALQESIIERQSQRKATGKYGNRNTWDYLNNLSGDTGVLKKKSKDDDKLEK